MYLCEQMPGLERSLQEADIQINAMDTDMLSHSVCNMNMYPLLYFL